MATLEKLTINGIRSFGEDEAGRRTINFVRPVTLILGANGCGKSTIIECLRFVTTNKEPTGRGAFVRDPNLTAHAIVKAAVKLKVKNTKGETIHLMRGIQATRTAKNITQRSLDATYSLERPGQEPVNISSRCVDITHEVIRGLGVSKAILDNVIFCTQEDSFWPLETDKALKEKFDQIFDSEKYNKCLVRVKDVQKKLKGSRGQLEQDLEHQREKKTAAQNKRRDVGKIEDKIQDMQTELRKGEAAMVPIQARLQEIRELEREIQTVYLELNTKKTELAGIEKEETALREKIEEFVGSDGDLEQAIAECMLQNRGSHELEVEKKLLEKEAENINSEIKNNRMRVGQLTKEVEINKSKLSQKEEKLRRVASACGGISPTEECIETYISNKEKELVSLQKSNEREEELSQQAVNKARDEVVNKQGDLRRLEQALKENQSEIAEIQKDLASVGESQLRRQNVIEQLQVAERELTEHQRKTDASQLSADLKQTQEQLKLKDAALTDADAEVKRLQGFSEIGREVDHLKIESNKKIAQNKLLLNSHRDALVELFGTMPEGNFKVQVEQRADRASVSGNDLRNKKAKKDGERLAFRSTIGTLNSELQKKTDELKVFQQQVYEICESVDLDDAVEKCSSEISELQKKQGDLNTSQHIFSKYIKTLNQPKPCCPLCSRDFAAEEEARLLKDKLTTQLRKFPADIEDTKRRLAVKEQHIRRLYDLQTNQSRMNKMRTEEIPSLESELSQKKTAVAQAVKEIEEIEKSLEKFDRERELCTTLIGDMAVIDQNMKTISTMKVDLARAEQKLPQGWHRDLLKTAQDLQEQASLERKQTERKRDTLQVEFTKYNEKLSLLQSKKHKLAEEELTLRSKEGQQDAQEEKLLNLRTSEQSLNQEVASARAVIPPLEQAHRRLTELHRRMKEDHKTSLKEEGLKLEGNRAQFRDIKRLQSEISDFSTRGDEMRLEALTADVTEREKLWQSTKIKIDNVTSQLNDFAVVEVRRLSLEANKTLREKIREKQTVLAKVSEVKGKLSKMNTEALSHEKTRLNFELDKISDKKVNILGQVGAFEVQKASIESELESNMYLDIEKKFTASLATMKIAEAQAQDLHRYSIAMDYAMGVYHKRAMEKVNGSIREYWTSIYRGNDIDYIEIQTEQAEATELRRSFNYKLIQVKNYTKMDMRNRCSAGQKMLACLIVRMALAEVFSNNCGILTLDEPTTNLDKKNIQCLATALNELIDAKSSMANTNFQLVVITHDKEFLHMLTSANDVESYIEMSRSPNGTSVIEVKSVKD